MRKILRYFTFASVCITAALVAACDTSSSNNRSNNLSETVPKAKLNGNVGLKIAYVNTDTLFEKYSLRTELEEEFIEEKLVLENQFKSQVSAFEKDYRDAEAGASQLSQEALQILSMKLQQREQELMVKKQELEGQLLQSEQLKNNKLFDKIRVFLDDYAADKGYHAIYGYTGYGDVLYMDAQFDITAEVVTELNANYENLKTSAGSE